MKKILITGGAGYIGSHTVVTLQEHGHTPVVVDNFCNADTLVMERIAQITGSAPELFEIDCTNYAAMENVFMQEGPFDAVMHFAAYKAIDESVTDPLAYYRNNIDGLLTVLELMIAHQVPHLIFSSTAAVYGDAETFPVTEEMTLAAPANPYGATKQMCEQMIKDMAAAHENFSATILRYFNPIGAHPTGLIGELPMGTPANLVPYITQVAAGLRKELVVYGDDYDTKDGTAERDYIHVMDLANAHVAALEPPSEETNNVSIYNVGTGTPRSVLEIIEAFQGTTEQVVSYSIGQRRPGDVPRIWADASKIKEVLGWTPEHSLEAALTDAWQWQSYAVEQKIAQKSVI